MHPITLLCRNLIHRRRTHFATILGVAVGTAVLAGALIVGDSLRGSLRTRAEQRLAGTNRAMVLSRLIDSPRNVEPFEPVLLLRGTVEADGPEGVRRVADVAIHGRSADVATGIAHLTPALARDLGVTTSATIRLRLPRFSAIARDSLLGKKSADDLVQTVETPARVMPADDPLGQFNLAPGFGPSRSVVLALADLQKLLGLEGKINGLLEMEGRPGELATVLGGRLSDFGLALRTPESRTDSLLALLDRDKDARLEPREYRRRLAEVVIRSADTNNDRTLTRDELLGYFRRRGTVDLEALGLLLPEPALVAAAAAAKANAVAAGPTLVYLANTIADANGAIPYSTIAAVDPQRPGPLGPYLDPAGPPLADDEILLAEWSDSPLTARPGDPIRVTYFLPESDGTAREATATFRLRGFVPLRDVGADPYLAPEFPGITDKLTLGEWDPPFPYDNRRITRKDDDFWDAYRGSPKAFVNLATGRKLFGSRFGSATSFRFATTDGAAIESALLKNLRSEEFGLTLEPVRDKLLAASQGGTDFGGLFLGFSFYLIVAALMLVGLLWKLSLDRRAPEIGLLLATGLRLATVRRWYAVEGVVVSSAGALVGLGLAVAYAWLMLRLLALLWPDGELGQLLTLHVTAQSLLIGLFATILLTAGVVWWAVRSMRHVAPVMLLRGVTEPAYESGGKAAPGRAGPIVAGLSGLVATVAGASVGGHEARAGAFFAGGALLLTAGLLEFRRRLRRGDRSDEPPSRTPAELGRRNMSRHPARSLLTAGLLAAAAFLLVVVESFRRHPAADFALPTGGSGGYDLVCTLDVPIYNDPADPATGRRDVLDALERAYQQDPATKDQRLKRAEELLAASVLVPLRLRPGDDAGCRNLARPDRPRLIGLPERFIRRGGFHFAAIPADAPAEPWAALERPSPDVPVFGEAGTIQWMLKSKPGGTLPIVDARGRPGRLVIAGTLQDSIFQGELLMAERRFLELFPETGGYAMLLASAPPGRADELRVLLETAFGDRGLAAVRAIDRVAPYLAVENTYLSTFQILGGLGLLLGAVGLAAVLLRAIAERRGELALLRAVGWPTHAVRGMLRAENVALVVVGLGLGTAAALAGITPMLVTGEASLRPLARVAVMLTAAVAVAALAGAAATRTAVRAEIVPALRQD